MSADAGETPDAGPDGGGPDGSTDAGTDAGMPESGCNVTLQRGCDAGALCLRGLQEDGGLGNVCFPGECDLVAQDCPAGNKCTYVRQGSETRRRCVPDETVAEGGTCQSKEMPGGSFSDTCKAGLYCTDRTGSGGTTFTCQKFCYGATQCTAPRECVDVLRFEGSRELPRVCGESGSGCDLLAQACGGSLGCYPSSVSRGAVCVTAGTVADGTVCAYSNDCRPGSACVQQSSGQVCRALCRLPSGTPACASGRCEPLQDFAGVGACVP